MKKLINIFLIVGLSIMLVVSIVIRNKMLGLAQRIVVMEKQVEFLNNIEPTTITEVVEVETITKEKPIYIQGGTVEKTELPEGHWERYCLYDKDVAGYPSEGVVIRQAQGDCDNDWKVIKLWEK